MKPEPTVAQIVPVKEILVFWLKGINAEELMEFEINEDNLPIGSPTLDEFIKCGIRPVLKITGD